MVGEVWRTLRLTIAYTVVIIAGLITVTLSNKYTDWVNLPYVYDLKIVSIDARVVYLIGSRPLQYVWDVDLYVSRTKVESVNCAEVREFLSIYSVTNMGQERGRSMRIREPMNSDQIHVHFFFGADDMESNRVYIADFRSECLSENGQVRGGQVAAPPITFISKCVRCAPQE